jgi:hypothetical protein
MAKSLSFDTGLVEYDINGMATVRFNPTDADFVERLWKCFTDLEARQGEFQGRVDEIEIGEHGEGGEKMFAYAKERDAEMRGIIDGLLGDGVADALFPDMNCYALADGLPVWVNLMFAIADEIEGAYTRQQKRTDPRVAGYSKKYDAMMKKYKGKKKRK